MGATNHDDAASKLPAVLLVDDEQDIRDVIGISLIDMGYTVHCAENGAIALNLFTELQPEIVITDIKMPGMDGIALLRGIKRINPETQVIMITGHGDMNLAIESFKDEAVDFITKPVDIDSLEQALKRAQEKIRHRSERKQYTQNLERLLLEKMQCLARMHPAEASSPEDGFQHIIDQLPCYVAVIDRDYRVDRVNQPLQQDFNLAPGALCHRQLMRQPTACDNCPVAKTFADGQSHQVELDWTTPAHGKTGVVAWTTNLRDGVGRTDRVLLMAAAMKDMLDFKDNLTTLGLMLASVSHSIKGLLTGIDGGVYLLDAGLAKDDPARMKEGLAILKQMVGRLRDMVLDILFYVKDRELKTEPVDLNRFMTGVIEELAPSLRADGIAWRLDPAPAPCWVAIDRDAMHTAVVNLLENARDACKSVDERQSTIQLDIECRSDHGCFAVQDNGVGMDAETQAHLFDLFYSRKGAKGTGLGLYITRRIVTRHDGRIDISSTPGQGTRVSVRLPRHVEDEN